jgi:hypothetical protein
MLSSVAVIGVPSRPLSSDVTQRNRELDHAATLEIAARADIRALMARNEFRETGVHVAKGRRQLYVAHALSRALAASAALVLPSFFTHGNPSLDP